MSTPPAQRLHGAGCLFGAIAVGVHLAFLIGACTFEQAVVILLVLLTILLGARLER